MSSKNNCSVPIYVFLQKGGGFSLKNLAIFQTIGHAPTQIYVNKTYIPHYNLAIIYIYFVKYIFFYIFFTFG
jgi:hypothetical protein